MKKIFLLVINILIISTFLLAQTPESFKYQAVLRNTRGEPQVKKDAELRISILQSSADGQAVYTELHSLTTNLLGMVNLSIGTGASSDDFSAIEWESAEYFLKVEMAVGRDRHFLEIGNSQLLSVPYALHSKSTMEVKSDPLVINNLDVSGKITVDQITVKTSVTGNDATYGSYPLQIEGGDQGIAIKVKGSRNNSNNYITFWDNNGRQGRIEGETNLELATNPEYIVENALYAADIVITGVEVGIAIAEEVQAIGDLAAAGTSSTGCVGVGACITAPIPSLIAAAATNLVLKTANLVAVSASELLVIGEAASFNAFKHANIGVTYQSGAGDYAEWLLKSNPNEKIYPGDVVGLVNGKISKNTNNANKVMVISNRPIVLGNMPEVGKELNFEKVAFMGQVPVKVYGNVKPGDYILPSGLNNGFGIAISPKDLKPEDYLKIVGVAWSGTNSKIYKSKKPIEKVKYVNVAVGLNANDVVELAIQQESKITKQKDEIKNLKNQLNKMNTVLAKLVPEYATSMELETIEQTDEIGYNFEESNKIVYFEVSEEQILEGVKRAKEKLIEQGVDVDKHPFFVN